MSLKKSIVNIGGLRSPLSPPPPLPREIQTLNPVPPSSPSSFYFVPSPFPIITNYFINYNYLFFSYYSPYPIPSYPSSISSSPSFPSSSPSQPHKINDRMTVNVSCQYVNHCNIYPDPIPFPYPYPPPSPPPLTLPHPLVCHHVMSLCQCHTVILICHCVIVSICHDNLS